MASFYYNAYSNEDIHSQWTRHLQNNAYVNDIDSIISQNRRELENTIQNASDEQKKAIQQVCGTLKDGFSEVNQHLKDINFNISELRGEINEMASMLDWKLSLVIEEQRLTNQLLGIVIELQRIPDSQKQRVYHVERGLKYLKNAVLEGFDSDFYIKSFENFKEAEKIEDDFVTLNKIGQIYLYSKKYLNISLAKEYFLKSAGEALAETNAGGTTTSNYLKPFGHHALIYSDSPFKAATAEAYLYAGRACYLQQKLVEAAEMAGKAYNLMPEFLVAGFEQAKYLAANDQVDEAVRVLEKIINKDRFFAIKTLEDGDLGNKSLILRLLHRLQLMATKRASEKLAECKVLVPPRSETAEIIAKIEEAIEKMNYLSSMKALDLLTKEYQLPYIQYNRDGERIRYTILTTSQDLLSFIKAENLANRHFLEIREEAKKEIMNNRVLSGGCGGAGIGFFIGFFKGCTIQTFSMDGGILFGMILAFAVAGAGFGALTAASADPEIYKT